ncbi:Hypothetical protein R9X50_00401500 [Acrodontium crateriforme]|uniref:Uncharacterized protein n=1 Tax=Acrodontium crateriforme TaxID=150365 RepID=A0AAQ3M4I0_9PEZI|nr:Hypothetical protein R9X50_00401500 [Acrodontium crateriforme]
MLPPPLPAGWDSDRVHSTNEIELRTLPAADRALIYAWRHANGEANDANLRALITAHDDQVNESRAKLSLPSLVETDRIIAQEMGMENYDPATQKALFDSLVDHKEEMDSKNTHEVRECFAELVEDAENCLPLGLELDLALMVDKASVDSLLDSKDRPFVWGVDINYNEDEAVDGEGDEEDGYPGHFKIAIDVLIPELWHTLDTASPDELYPGAGKIYRGIVGEVEDEIADRTLLADE